MKRLLPLLILITTVTGCISLPAPEHPSRSGVLEKQTVLENFSVVLTPKELEYEKIPDYSPPKYERLAEGPDSCGQEAVPVVKVNVTQIKEISVQIEGELKKVPIADQASNYYKEIKETVPGEQVEVIWRTAKEGETETDAVFNENDVRGCQITIEQKRVYYSLLNIVIKELQEHISLRNKDREVAQIFQATMKKEMALEILKRDIKIELLFADLQYSEDMVKYVEALREREGLLFKAGSIVGFISLAVGAIAGGL